MPLIPYVIQIISCITHAVSKGLLWNGAVQVNTCDEAFQQSKTLYVEETGSDPLHLLTFTPIHNLTLHIYIFRRINVAPYLIPHRLQRILQAALAFLSFADQTSLCYLSSVSVGQNRNPHLVPSAPFHQNLSKTIPSCH